MPVFDFTLRLNRMPDDDEIEALYEAGCGDATFSSDADGAVAEFHREASTWADALGSAARAVETVPGLMAIGAGQDDQVTMLDIARRAGRSREAVRLWVAGKRGPGGFPAPSWTSPSGERFWSWRQVAKWLRIERGLPVEYDMPDEIWWADAILKTRLAQAEADRLRAEHPAFSRAFERQLRVA